MRRLLVLVILATLAMPGTAAALDDPIVTIRVLCNGFNVLDMDAVLGEISDSATLNVDGPVRGDQIHAWVKQQMDKDLRIEIVDIGTPKRLPDGYALDWTARFSRQDWRASGTDSRLLSNRVVIHNGRITDWTATVTSSTRAADEQDAQPAAGPVGSTTAPGGWIPEVFGVPVTLLIAAGMVVAAAAVMLRKLVA